MERRRFAQTVVMAGVVFFVRVLKSDYCLASGTGMVGAHEVCPQGGQMKLASVVVAVTLGLLSGTATAHAQQTAPQTDNEKRSYAVGVQVAEGIKSQGVDVDPAMVAAGVRDALAGTKLLMSDDEIEAAIGALEQDMRQKQEQARTALLEKNKKAGEEFLAANGKKEGIVSLPSGLQYKILTAGQGRNPTDDDTVVCNYRGTLLDGKEFDSSYGREPATFGVKDVIPGFREAVKLMSAGAKWQLFIPAELAYGERGAGNAIEPNATLIFELELISIQEKP
jgi:FKBP-type peptidyl-prolyl cis-trans isomerase